MIFKPIPEFTVEDNAKYSATTEGTKGTYKVIIVVDECDDDRLITREEPDIEHTTCTCPDFVNRKKITCKHIDERIEDLRSKGVKIRLGVSTIPIIEKTP